MKKWECEVCGFIHEGEAPPEKCQVCDSPSQMFVLMLEPDKDGVEPAAAAADRRWRCTVCGYIHEAAEPPEKCPVCAAARNMFVEIDAEGKQIGESAVPAEPAPAPLEPAGQTPGVGKHKSPWLDRLAGLSMKMHLHPITVHFPNGVLPVVLVFLGLGIIFKIEALETAAYYNLVFVLVTLPLVLLTGFLEWQKRYKGARTAIFIGKILAALTVLATANVLVFWRLLDPGVLAEGSPSRLIYLGVAAGMLAAAGIAGYLGGKLVFAMRR